MAEKKALITGCTGQDGSYLAELLLSKGYKVYGLKRRTSTPATRRIAHIINDIELVEGDLSDSTSIHKAIKYTKPDELYNMAAQSFVKASFAQPELTADVTGIGVLRILEALKTISPATKMYQASSSEMFGASAPPQSEKSAFYPRSPYGVAKVFGFWITVNYREAHNMFGCNGILFNHESPRRGSEFVTQKIAQHVAAIKQGYRRKLRLGNLEAKRDWGHARDYVEAMWMMLQHPTPSDYVVATGESHTVREFADIAFKRVGLDYKEHVEIDQKFMRPTEVDHLLGDPSRTMAILGWKPKTSFEGLVNEMVDHAMDNTDEWVQEIGKE